MQKKQQKAIGVPGHQVLAEPVHLGQARDNMAVVLAPAVATLEGEGEVGVASTSILSITSDVLGFF